MSGSTSILDSLSPVQPTAGMLASQSATSQQPVPSSGGDIPTVTVWAQKPSNTSVLDSLTPVPPTPGMMAANPQAASSWRGIARNAAAGLVQGGEGALNVLSDPFGNLVGRPLLTAFQFAHDALAPSLGYDRFTPEQRADLTGDTTPQTGTRLGHTVGSLMGAPMPEDVPANGPAERLTRKVVGGATSVAALGPAGLVAPMVGAGGAIVGDQLAQAVPDWAQPGAELGGNVAGGLTVEGGAAAGSKLGAPISTALGEHGVALPRWMGGPGKTTIMSPDEQGNIAPAIGSNGKPLRATESQINKAAGKVTKAVGPDMDQFQTALQEPDSQVPGVQRTLAQQAPVPGLVDLDTAYRTAYGKEFNARSQAQGAALTNAVGSVAPEGANPQAVGEMFTGQLAALEAERNADAGTLRGVVRQNNPASGGVGTPEAQGAAISQAVENQQTPLRQAAQQKVNAAQTARNDALSAAPGGRQPIPGGATVPEQYGAESRGQAMVERQSTVDREGTLWRAINPDGNAGAYSEPFKQRVGEVYGAIPRSAAQPSGEEAAIASTIKQWPDLVPLTEVQALRSRINDEISREIEGAGKTPTVVSRRLTDARNALDSALEQTLNAHGEQQAQAVASGHLAPEQTIFANLQREVEAWHASRQANDLAGSSGVGGGFNASSSSPAAISGRGGGENYGGYSRGGSSSSAGVSGTAGAAGRQSAAPAGVQGIPRAERPLTAEELQAGKTARAFSQRRAQTFDEGPVGDILAPGEFRTQAKVPENVTRAKGGFATQDAEVLGRIWNAKTTESANLRAAQEAGISPETLKNWAADDLRGRAVGQDNSFDLKEYAKWRRDHAAGLHVFPEVAKAFDSAAHAQETLSAAQSEVSAVEQAHPLRGTQYLSEVPGRYFQAGDTGADAVRAFVRDTKGDPHAMQALDDYVVYRMSKEPGLVQPDGTIDQRALGRFQQKYAGALSQRNELSDKLSSLSNAQGALDAALSDHNARIEAFQNGVAQSFLKDDPTTAVRKAFSSGNPKQTFQRLVDAVRHNDDALAGLRRSVADFIIDKMSSARPANEELDFLKAGQFRAWVRHNRDAVREVFGGQGMQNLEQVVAEMRKQAFRAEAASGSPTTQRLIGAEKAGLRDEHKPSTVFGAIIGEHLGHAAGGVPLLGTIAGAAVSKFSHVFKQAGINTTNDLVRTMLLNISVTRELMARVANGKVGPVAAQRIGRALQASLLSNAQSGTQETRE